MGFEKDFPAEKLAHKFRNQNLNFTGREGLIRTLETNLKEDKTIALYGLGGVGKTQLVIEYIHRYKNSYKVVWWVNSENIINLRTEYGNLGVKLEIIAAKAELDTKVTITKEWLDNNGEWLVIFDNVGEPENVRPYLAKGGHNLITSRYQAWGQVSKKLEIKVWSSDETINYLTKRFKNEGYISYNNEVASELAEELGYLPLALAQAAAYMESTKISLAEYLKIFKSERKDLWQIEKPPDQYQKEVGRGTVVTTWQMALKQIEKTEGAKELMNVCSYLASEAIPLSLLIDNAELLGEPLTSVLNKTIKRNKAIETLLSYSLISKDEDDSNLLYINRLVQTVVRDGLSEEWLKTSIALLSKAFNFRLNKFETWKVCEPLSAHARQVINHAEGIKEEDLAKLCNALASYHRDYIVIYDEAEALFKKAIKISKETIGEEHANYADYLGDFALLLWNMGRYEEAEPLYRQAIEIAKATIGEEHPDYVKHLNNLALLLKKMNCYEEAELLYRQVIEIDKITIGEKHPDYAIHINNLALLLKKMDRYEEAEPLLRQAIEIGEITTGKYTPNYAKRLSNLALLLKEVGSYEEAESLYRQAIEIDKMTIGEGHPEHAKHLYNLASLLAVSTGRDGEVNALYEQAIYILTKTLGGENSSTKTVKKRYQDFLDKQSPNS